MTPREWGMLLATTPLFTVVVAHFLTADERLSPGRVAGIAAGIIMLALLRAVMTYLMTVGVGGYVIGRSAEKGIRAWKEKEGA